MERRTRALRAAVEPIALESLELRRMFAYSPSASHITGAWDQSSMNVEFDTAVVGSDEIVAVGKAANDSVSLFGLDGQPSQANALTIPDPSGDDDSVSQFGSSVEFVGDKLAISAFDDDGAVVYVFEPDGNGVYDNNPEAVFRQINIVSSIPMAEFGNQLLVRTADAVNVYDLGGGGSLDHAIAVATNAPNNDAIATNGDNIVVTSDVGGDTQVLEFDGVSGTQVRNFTFGAGSGSLALTLAMSDGGDVFIGDVDGSIVYQFADEANLSGPVSVPDDALHTYTAEGTDTLSPQSLTVSGDELLVGVYGDGGVTFSTVYDITSGSKKQELTVADATGGFGLTARAISNGYAISDYAGDGATGAIYFFTEAAAPVPPAQLVGGNLIVTGTSADETIVVKVVNGSLQVFFGTNQIGTFPVTSVTGNVQINGGEGNDTITADSSVARPAIIHGGEGNDTITGGGGDDFLFGDGGNDRLFARQGSDVALGGDGSDILYGGNGRDVLIGGEGNDSIEGENADDILVAGFTSHDSDVAALASIRNQWNASTDYATRVANLRTGLLSTTNVFDDSDIDTLIGGNGQDWFLAQKDGILDLIVDQKKSETSTDVV